MGLFLTIGVGKANSDAQCTTTTIRSNITLQYTLYSIKEKVSVDLPMKICNACIISLRIYYIYVQIRFFFYCFRMYVFLTLTELQFQSLFSTL